MSEKIKKITEKKTVEKFIHSKIMVINEAMARKFKIWKPPSFIRKNHCLDFSVYSKKEVGQFLITTKIFKIFLIIGGRG